MSIKLRFRPQGSQIKKSKTVKKAEDFAKLVK